MRSGGIEHWDWDAIYARCRREALRIVRRQHDAEEVVQEALIRAWRSRKSCRTPEAPMGWCLQITRNEANRLLGRPSPSFVEITDAVAELADTGVPKEADLAVARLDIQRVLEGLTPNDRLLLSLRYVGGCSHPEIAAAFQITESTARVRLHRLQRRLRDLL